MSCSRFQRYYPSLKRCSFLKETHLNGFERHFQKCVLLAGRRWRKTKNLYFVGSASFTAGRSKAKWRPGTYIGRIDCKEVPAPASPYLPCGGINMPTMSAPLN